LSVASNDDAIAGMLVFALGALATAETYTLSLHDALPIFTIQVTASPQLPVAQDGSLPDLAVCDDNQDGITHFDFTGQTQYVLDADRKSTRLNSSHVKISYAVFCLKQKRIQRADVRGSSTA